MKLSAVPANLQPDAKAALAVGYEIKVTLGGQLHVKRPGKFTRFEPFWPRTNVHHAGQLVVDYAAKKLGGLNAGLCKLVEGIADESIFSDE
jgi:hypothetical protein